MMKTTTQKTQKLARDTQAVFVHGTTGQDVAIENLAAGTLVRVEETLEDGWVGPEVQFLASSDGKTWYRYRMYGRRLPVEA